MFFSNSPTTKNENNILLLQASFTTFLSLMNQKTDPQLALQAVNGTFDAKHNKLMSL